MSGRTPGESLASTVIAGEEWEISPMAEAVMVVAFGEAIDLAVRAAVARERKGCLDALYRERRAWMPGTDTEKAMSLGIALLRERGARKTRRRR